MHCWAMFYDFCDFWFVAVNVMDIAYCCFFYIYSLSTMTVTVARTLWFNQADYIGLWKITKYHWHCAALIVPCHSVDHHRIGRNSTDLSPLPSTYDNYCCRWMIVMTVWWLLKMFVFLRIRRQKKTARRVTVWHDWVLTADVCLLVVSGGELSRKRWDTSNLCISMSLVELTGSAVQCSELGSPSSF